MSWGWGVSSAEKLADGAMDVAVSIERDIPSRITGENRVFIRAVIARAITAAVAAEREALQALLAHGAPHSPRRYIYDNTADRRIWACDQLDAAIRSRSQP